MEGSSVSVTFYILAFFHIYFFRFMNVFTEILKFLTV